MKAIIKKIINIVRNVYNNVYIYYSRILKEPNNFSVPIRKKFEMYLSGFTPNHYVLYAFDKNDKKDYLTDWYRWKTREINGRYNVVLDDKLIFEEVFKNDLPIVEHLFILKEGNIILSDFLFDETGLRVEELNMNFFKENFLNETLVFKPNYGKGAGIGIFKVEFKEDYVKINSIKKSYHFLEIYLSDLDDYIANKFIDQHDYSKKIYSKTVNTIRIVTLFNPQIKKSEVVMAAHRIGNMMSYPVDNASKGAYIALIDLNTGKISQAKSYQSTEQFKFHPETKSQIEGVEVPNWDKIISNLEKVSSKYYYIPYISWDVVVQEKGFTIIEANASTGLTLFQLWGGLKGSKFHKLLDYHLEDVQ